MNNYRRNLEYDLRDLRSKIQEILPAYRSAESRYEVAKQTVCAKQIELEQAERERDSCKETFRALHQPLCYLKQEVGEIQDELFRYAEDESEWLH